MLNQIVDIRTTKPDTNQFMININKYQFQYC